MTRRLIGAVVALLIGFGAAGCARVEGVPGEVGRQRWRLIEVVDAGGVVDASTTAAHIDFAAAGVRWSDGVNTCDGTLRGWEGTVTVVTRACTAAGFSGDPDSAAGRTVRAFGALATGESLVLTMDDGLLVIKARNATMRLSDDGTA